jgi:hypothetical protein
MRLRVVFGGYRFGRQLELWVVPPAGAQPVAQPALRSPRWRSGRS